MNIFINAIDKVFTKVLTLEDALETFAKMSTKQLTELEGCFENMITAEVMLRIKKEGYVCYADYADPAYRKIKNIITKGEIEDEYSNNKSR